MCTSGKFCRSKRCQFKHEVTVTVDDELDANNVINENEVEPTDDMECEECTFNTDESVYHKNDIIQECSQCDFETKCEAAYDAHWASTPGHRFSQWETNECDFYLLLTSLKKKNLKKTITK